MTKLNISAIKKQLRKDRQSELPAFLGNLSGTVSADRNGNVYATLLNGEVLTVYNGMVPNVARLPIVIGYGGSDKLRILRSRDVYVTPPFPDVPGHAALHTFPGVDTVPIRAEQFLPGLVTPAGGYTVKIYGLSYQLSDGWHVLPTQTLDLEASVPADGAVFALLEVDDTGIVQVTLGSAVDSRSAMEYSDIPATSSNCIALAAVKLYTGQTNILQTINNDNDIIDLRFGRASAGGVQTISGDGVDNTDPLNPVLSYPTPADIGAEPALGYTPENVANKKTTMTGNESSNTFYLTAKAIYDWATGLFLQKNAPITSSTNTKITYDANGLVTSGTSLSASDIPSGIDATKIGSGSVDNTEFGYLNGVTSAIQTQLDGKVPNTTRYLLAFSSYASLGSPITAASSPAFPYAGTLPSFTVYVKQWSQGLVIGATNNVSNYWTFDLLYTASGVVTVAATFNTSALSANSTVVVVVTTFDKSSYSQSNIRFAIRAIKTGTPSDISAHGPAVEYTLS